MCDEAHDQDQALELEGLEAIFLTDYELLEGSVPRRAKLRLMPCPGDFTLGGEENRVAVAVTFTLPPAYPDEVPGVSVEALVGLTTKHCEMLASKARSEAAGQVGAPMLFSLAESLKDWLAANNRDHTDESMFGLMAQKYEAEQRAAEQAEALKRRAERTEAGGEDDAGDGRPRVIDGTPVTELSFKQWQARFVAEAKAAKDKADGPAKAPAKGAGHADAALSGRAYFESGRFSKDSQAAAAAAGPNGGQAAPVAEWDQEIQEGLFLDDATGLDDLDDLDSDDEDEDYVEGESGEEVDDDDDDETN